MKTQVDKLANFMTRKANGYRWEVPHYREKAVKVLALGHIPTVEEVIRCSDNYPWMDGLEVEPGYRRWAQQVVDYITRKEAE